MQYRTVFVTLFLALAVALPVHAEEARMGAALKQRLSDTFGGLPDSANTTPVDGLLEVSYGTNVFYVTKNGDYLINGEMFDLDSRTNLTEKRLSKSRLDVLKDIDESSMIIYKAKGKEKHVITVFTDIDCVYCRKLHSGMKEMNELGITVRYLAYPRAGVNSPSYYKAVSVWCADDRNKAMDEAKNMGKVAQKRCEDSPVRKQMEAGTQLGVSGTPAIVFSDGHLMPGYAPPQKLAAILDKQLR